MKKTYLFLILFSIITIIQSVDASVENQQKSSIVTLQFKDKSTVILDLDDPSSKVIFAAGQYRNRMNLRAQDQRVQKLLEQKGFLNDSNLPKRIK